MKLGLSALLFPKASVEEVIKFSAKLGAECVEIIYDVPHFQPDYDQRKLSGIKELLDAHGLGVSVHGSFWDLNPASHHHAWSGDCRTPFWEVPCPICQGFLRGGETKVSQVYREMPTIRERARRDPSSRECNWAAHHIPIERRRTQTTRA